MIVLDASAVVEYLLNTPKASKIYKHLEENVGEVCAPHLCVAETISVLRSLVARKEISEHRAMLALNDLKDFSMKLYPSTPFMYEIWELKDNLSAYDAHYLVLANKIQAPLITCDQRITKTPQAQQNIITI